MSIVIWFEWAPRRRDLNLISPDRSEDAQEKAVWPAASSTVPGKELQWGWGPELRAPRWSWAEQGRETLYSSQSTTENEPLCFQGNPFWNLICSNQRHWMLCDLNTAPKDLQIRKCAYSLLLPTSIFPLYSQPGWSVSPLLLAWDLLSGPRHQFVNVSMIVCTQLCSTLCDPVDCSPPGSSVHGILQARILAWVAMPFSKGSSRPRGRTQISRHCQRILYLLSSKESPRDKCGVTEIGYLIQTAQWLLKPI